MEEMMQADAQEQPQKAIRNRTLMTTENSMLATRAQRKKIKIILSLFIVVLIGAIALIFAMDALESGDLFDWIFPAVMGILLVGFLLWIWFAFDKSTAKSTEKLLDYITEELEYEFGENEIVVHERFGDGVSMDMRFAYRRVKNFVEYDGFFTFSVLKTAIYMVDKSGMTEGSADELAAMVQARLGTLYTVKTKKRK